MEPFTVPVSQICSYFNGKGCRGNCGKLHVKVPSNVCPFWISNSCRHGTRCRHDHPESIQVSTDASELTSEDEDQDLDEILECIDRVRLAATMEEQDGELGVDLVACMETYMEEQEMEEQARVHEQTGQKSKVVPGAKLNAFAPSFSMP